MFYIFMVNKYLKTKNVSMWVSASSGWGSLINEDIL